MFLLAHHCLVVLLTTAESPQPPRDNQVFSHRSLILLQWSITLTHMGLLICSWENINISFGPSNDQKKKNLSSGGNILWKATLMQRHLKQAAFKCIFRVSSSSPNGVDTIHTSLDLCSLYAVFSVCDFIDRSTGVPLLNWLTVGFIRLWFSSKRVAD